MWTFFIKLDFILFSANGPPTAVEFLPSRPAARRMSRANELSRIWRLSQPRSDPKESTNFFEKVAVAEPAPNCQINQALTTPSPSTAPPSQLRRLLFDFNPISA